MKLTRTTAIVSLMLTKWNLLFPKRGFPRGCVSCDEQSRPVTELSDATFIPLGSKYRHSDSAHMAFIVQLHPWCSGFASDWKQICELCSQHSGDIYQSGPLGDNSEYASVGGWR